MTDVNHTDTQTPPLADTNRVWILGSPVDRVGPVEALDRIEALLKDPNFHLIVTADASGLVLARTDPEFAAILRRAALVTPDSAGVLWAARRRGRPIPARASGVELLDALCARSADRGHRIFLLGAEPGVAEMAAERLRLRHPGCHIVGFRHGYFPPESDELVARQIAEAKPDILFVAMGIPRQEKFLARYGSLTGARVGMGVGGSLDVFSGRVKRAPQWIQRLNLEWLWRVALDPKKLPKVLTLPRFVGYVLRER